MVIEKELKSKLIRYSGRSSDYIFPTIVQGCFGKCSYCYAARHSPDNFYNNIKISTNLDDIIETVRNFIPDIEKPNQTHEKYISWDIACNSDIVGALHYIDYEKLINYFKESDRDFGTFATKFVNHRLLKYDAEKKMRVRMSLMPEKASQIVEPNTANIMKRIDFMNKLILSGYEVHINFSPVIFTIDWIKDYSKLFDYLNLVLSDKVKEQLKCEVIFLTHNKNLHEYNQLLSKPGEQVLWIPSLQEKKTSGFGGDNIRYEHRFKQNLIEEFKELLKEKLPYCEIRYIF